MPDRYAAGAAMGLAVYVSAEGLDRLAICASAPCQNVFIDTSSNRSRRFCSDRCAARAGLQPSPNGREHGLSTA